uniref:Uncharacterized protein n=1 Tax=Octopus bimaculoides TaxID=37653 RepID=A0A0L8IFY5_OCTBM
MDSTVVTEVSWFHQVVSDMDMNEPNVSQQDICSLLNQPSNFPDKNILILIRAVYTKILSIFFFRDEISEKQNSNI